MGKDRIPILQLDPEVFSLPEVFCKKGSLGNFAKFTGKHLWQNLPFNKVIRETIKEYKRDTGKRVPVFTVNFAIFLRTLFL